MDRRAFLTAAAAGWIADRGAFARAPLEGRIVGASHAAGHRLRDGLAALPAPAAAGGVEKADVVIVGSGISGLSAAWRLGGAGLDLLVLELEPFLGGTSTWSDDGAVPHPWGAHYLPAPNPEARAAIRLLHDIGAVTGWDAAGRAQFDGRLLCHAPEERLFYAGEWHPGLVPTEALDAATLAELQRFTAATRELTDRVGSDGRPAFQIPVDLSSRDPALLSLDRLTMEAWLDREGYRSPFLRWYVRYACLDDFGGEPSDVSAWAGLHYFAARKLKSPEIEGSHFLVWPEGNGRLVKALRDGGHPRIHHGALCTSVSPLARGRVEIRYLDLASGETRRIEARGAVVATPAFIARRLVPAAAPHLPERASSPWLVANLHVEGAVDPDLPWDSVLYGAEGLGYVDAHHQLTSPTDRTVLTYYRAYGSAAVAASRAALLNASWDELCAAVFHDLAPAHPHLRNEVRALDVMLWGHGMPRPRPGFLGETPFDAPLRLAPAVAWAHVDQTGMALFEEAQARGVRAAEAIAADLGVRVGETWL